MVKLREIPRTAAFAWSPGSRLPFIATGTKAGAVDADFSSDTTLELWDLDLSNTNQNQELKPAASITTESRFHDITWVEGGEGRDWGVIAGALEDGSLDIWDAEKLSGSDSGDALISHTTKHTGAIKTLQFNAFRHELLATAGAKGELFISDLNNIGNPFRLGNMVARADDFECLDWNKKVPHILVTGSSGGFVTVWDVKSKKESLTLNNHGRKAVSAVAWDPEQSTRLITAVPLDTNPLILVWDLRNTNEPQKVMQGHEAGVLSLSWCQQDNSLLLSCGKDNRTICWDPQSGNAFGEFPVVTNWTFQTRWNPHNPSILATASFDGKIAVQTIQNTKSDATQNAQAQALDGEDFFNKAQSQPQVASFSLPKAPKWMERPCGASFGFGGKIIKFGIQKDSAGVSRTSMISVSEFAIDDEIGTMTEAFARAMNEKDLKNVCETRIGQASLESEKTDWKVIETLVADNPRKELITYIGISKVDDDAGQPNGDDNLDLSKEDGAVQPISDVSKTNGNRLSSFFDAGLENDNFLTELASTKGAKTNNPFHIYTSTDSEAEKKITQALLLGQFEKAMEICLADDRLSDAFMIAICGGQACMDKVQKAYFKKQASGPRYLRLLASVVGKNLWDVVYNADLENWREVMATLCTYASAEEFPDLCEALGDRLEEQFRHDSSNHSHKQNASFCYIAGSKLEKVVGVWIAELEYNEQRSLEDSSDGSIFSIHARSLQNFIEKVTVFRNVTRYQDKDLKASSDWRLTELYEKYIEYADIVAAHGHLRIAEEYLNLLPDKYPAADVARNRVKQAMKKVNVTQSSRSIISSMPSVGPSKPLFEEQKSSASGISGPYAPANITQPSVPYAPVLSHQVSGPYAPQNPISHGSTVQYQPPQASQPPTGRPIVAPPPSFIGSGQGPPRTSNASPAVHPLSKASGMTNWNDTPEEFFKAPTSRRGTPAVPPLAPNAAFLNQQIASSTPTIAGQPFVIPKPAPAPPPPPPKGPAPPPRTQTPQMGSTYQQQPPERPSSSAANIYAPHTSLAQSQQPSQVPRGPSPYNPPPAGMQPGSGRYAPAPNVQQQPTVPIQSQRPPPPPNPFARPSFSSPSDPGLGQGPPSIGPPQGLQGPMMPPGAGSLRDPARGQQIDSHPPPRPQKPPTPKYSPGDRSHIPPSAQSIYKILSQDMQRVKSQAPTSFNSHVVDAEKRLNILYDNLNNETLLKPNTIQDMNELAQAVRDKEYDKAMSIHLDLITNRMEECGNWMTGVKRLIIMSRSTP